MQTHTTKRRINYKPSIVMDGASASSLKSTSAAIVMAALSMLVLGSKALLSWANDLPISKASDLLLVVTQQWQDWMEEAGITHFASMIFDALRWLQARSW